MPKTKFQSVVFTAITAWIMVYVMTLYNTVLASILGTYHGYGFTGQVIPNYIMTYCRNFIMALPVQIFVAGPIARGLFRKMFQVKAA